MAGLKLTVAPVRKSWVNVSPDDYRIVRNENKRATRNTVQNARADAHDLTFIAIDGEGIGIGKDHKYVLLGVGQDQIENPDGLAWHVIFDYLYAHYLRNPKAIFTGFYLGYDFTQTLKGIPYNRALTLLNPAGIKPNRIYPRGLKSRERTKSGANHTPYPVVIDVPAEYATGCDHAEDELPPAGHVHVQGRYWQFDLLPPARRFRLRPKYCRCIRSDCYHQTGCKHPPGQAVPAEHHHWPGVAWMYICDAGPFFQTSLLSAIDPGKWSEPIVTAEEYELLKAGKDNRDHAKLDDDMRLYNRLENDVLARLLSRLNAGLVQAGIKLGRDQWFGPGQAAQEWMLQQHDLIRREQSAVPAWVRKIAQLTYYGGWMEIMAHGHVPGTTWEYDVNSAYPYVMASLPCLEHGRWTRGRGNPSSLRKGLLRMVRVTVHGNDDYLGPLPHRNPDGNILRPLNTKGWYWHHELLAAVNAGLVSNVEFHEWAEYEPCACQSPLHGLAELYDQRLQAGKNTPYGKALKLIYNSVYGKLAQSVGHPKYGNPVYASLITAGCRTLILNAIASHPGKSRAVVMVATDGVYFTSQHPKLKVSQKLGDWDETTHSNLTLFKPGVYWHDKARQAIASGQTPEFKSRGVSAKALAKVIALADSQFDHWNVERGGFPIVRFRIGFSMVTMPQALQGKNGRTWDKAGWVSNSREFKQDSNPEQKRFPILEYDESLRVYRSSPYTQGERLESTPYEKQFGWDDDKEYEFGDTDDGSVLNNFRQSLLMR